MKRLSLCMAMTAVALIFSATVVMARPALSRPADVRQPDGTVVTLTLHGDEFLNFYTTTDGYTVITDDSGFYCYAEKVDGLLRPTTVRAANPDDRTAADNAFLASRKKMLTPALTPAKQELCESAATLYQHLPANTAERRRVNRAGRQLIDYTKFKGLIILVEFNNRTFLRDDAAQFYQDITSKKNMTHYTDRQGVSKACKGSMRDYFYDNSMGIFDPTFDVVGPVQISYSDKAAKQTDNMRYILQAALRTANATVDYTDYDLDNNGVVDMVYFIFAGYGSNISGNDKDYVWPHASTLSYFGLAYDGMRFDRYACSTEIMDLESQASAHQYLDGIGTMCHEFSHVLGLADHYDTDYEENGQAKHPDAWDLMAGGADFDYGWAPVGYSAYERYSLGFTPLQRLDQPGEYQLEPFNTSNKFFLVKSGTSTEDFYLENRQQQGWDEYLPGHGLLVWRVDSSNIYVWNDNKVNVNPDHTYLDIVRSAPGHSGSGNYDTFPGLNKVTDLTASSMPAFRTWYDTEAEQDLYDIRETDDGLITFTAGKNIYPSFMENFEDAPLTTADAEGVKGVFCQWDLTAATIAETGDNDQGSGSQVAILKRNGTLTSSALDLAVRTLSFKVWTAKAKVIVSLSAFIDGAWKPIADMDGNEQITIARNTAEKILTYRPTIPAGSKIQLKMISTTSSAVAYIDDMAITFYEGSSSGISDAFANGRADSPAYNLSGQRVGRGYRGIVVSSGRKVSVR